MLAVLPGIALQELWQIVGIAETALIGVSVMVVATALLGMCVMLLSGLEARRREIAIFRAMGARPGTVLLLLMLEAFLTALAGVLAGGVTLYAGLLLARPWIDSAFGLWLPIHPPDGNEIRALAAILLAGLLSGLVPAWRAYRQSLSDGMTLRH